MNNASEKKNVLTEELIDNLDLILDAIHDDLLISDSQGKVIFVNETFENVYSLNREEAIGKTVYQLEEEGYFKPSIVALVLKEKKKLSLRQTTNLGRDVPVTATPVFDEEGGIRFVFSFSRDITELLELEDKVQQYSEELNRLRGGDAEDQIIAESREEHEMQ